MQSCFWQELPAQRSVASLVGSSCHGEAASVAMVSTPRAKHCEDLLWNLQMFLPTKQCFLLESGPDLESKEVATNDAFFLHQLGLQSKKPGKNTPRDLRKWTGK